MAEHPEDQWTKFLAQPSYEGRRVLWKLTKHWAIDVLTQYGVPPEDQRRILAEVLRHMRCKTLSLSGMDWRERLDSFPFPESVNAERIDEGKIRKWQSVTTLRMYLAAVTCFYWWKHESENNTNNIAKAAKALVASLYLPMERSARNVLKTPAKKKSNSLAI